MGGERGMDMAQERVIARRVSEMGEESGREAVLACGAVVREAERVQ